jgi:hypothetical protein
MFAAFDLSVRHLLDRARIAVLTIDERFLALNPAEETRLVRPHINRVGQNGPALEPDDLLMTKGPDFIPDALEDRLPGRCVPAIEAALGAVACSIATLQKAR